MEPVTTEGQQRPGEMLRQGRLRQRLSVVECAKRTHIAQRYIEALEEERWADLPSESHRLGFLKLYSRFLGVSADDVLKLYAQKSRPVAAVPVRSDERHTPSGRQNSPSSPRTGWTPNAIPQIIGFGILILLLAWVVYHAVSPRLLEQNPMPWVHRRAPHQARLDTPKASVSAHKVNLKAQSSSWIRVTSRKELLFEGILPAGATKEWKGPGPFVFKFSDVKAVMLFWNDQPVDILLGSHGSINEVRIPPQ